jgi:hypothetical protein
MVVETLFPDVVLGEARQHRAEKARSIEAALNALRPGWKRASTRPSEVVNYALLQQTLYEATCASTNRDVTRADDALAIWAEPLLAGQKLLVLDSGLCRRSDDSRFQSPVFTATQVAIRAGNPIPSDVVASALARIETAGFGQFWREAAGVVVVLGKRRGPGLLSYTLRSFDGTVFSDWTEEPFYLAESLLHESCHSWFNTWLDAINLNLPSQPELFSPWKDARRPPFGYLHAVLAFSTLTLFFKATRNDRGLSLDVKRYCEHRMSEERERLRLVERDVRRLLSSIRNDRLEVLISRQLDLALREE